MTTLDSIEKDARLKIRAFLPEAGPTSSVKAFIVGFLALPFALTAILFIPLFGPLLVLLNLGFTIYYFWLVKRWGYTVAGVSGALFSLVLWVLSSGILRDSFEVVMYPLLALCIACMLTYLFMISGVIWLRFEQARVKMQQSVSSL